MLSELPIEILEKIYFMLDKNSFCNLRLVSKRVRECLSTLPKNIKFIYTKESINIFSGYNTLVLKDFTNLKEFLYCPIKKHVEIEDKRDLEGTFTGEKGVIEKVVVAGIQTILEKRSSGKELYIFINSFPEGSRCITIKHQRSIDRLYLLGHSKDLEKITIHFSVNIGEELRFITDRNLTSYFPNLRHINFVINRKEFEWEICRRVEYISYTREIGINFACTGSLPEFFEVKYSPRDISQSDKECKGELILKQSYHIWV